MTDQWWTRPRKQVEQYRQRIKNWCGDENNVVDGPHRRSHVRVTRLFKSQLASYVDWAHCMSFYYDFSRKWKLRLSNTFVKHRARITLNDRFPSISNSRTTASTYIRPVRLSFEPSRLLRYGAQFGRLGSRSVVVGPLPQKQIRETS